MKKYQELAARTIKSGEAHLSNKDSTLVCNAIGLAGESGEVADKVKKVIFHGHKLDLSEIGNELGDVLWYVAALCTALGLDMEDVMADNIAKLDNRYPTGYSDEDSIKRADVNSITDNRITQENLVGIGFRFVREGSSTMTKYVGNDTWIVVNFFTYIGTCSIKLEKEGDSISLPEIKTMGYLNQLIHAIRGGM